MTSFQNLIVARTGNVLHVTLNKPATRNSLSLQMVAELREVARQCVEDTSLRCVVLRGAQGNFCGGGNFADFQPMLQSPVPPDAADPIAVADRTFGHMLQAWRSVPQVLIAIVEGAAMGGGVGLAAIADITLAASNAQFAMPEVSLGLSPTQIAPFVALRIGQAHTRRLTLTAARIDSWQALELGLVTEVLEGVDQLNAALQKILRTLLRHAPRALASTKAVLNHHDAQWLEATLDFAALQFSQALRSGDAEEGVAAYAAKRTAAWVELPSENN